VLDLNRINVSATPLSAAINNLIEAAEPPEENVRRRVNHRRRVPAQGPVRLDVRLGARDADA
jgi:hypothetical protein